VRDAPVADKLEVVDELVRRLEARFGPGIIYRLAQARPKVDAVTLSSGSLGLDRASGSGGVPRGRLTLYRGGESSGKTTLVYHLLAEAQRDGGLAALIDGEGAADPPSLRACGVDLDDLILASPRDAAEALEMVEILVRCRALDAVVATALPPSRPGLLAQGLRRLNAWLKEAPTATVVVDGAVGRLEAGRARRPVAAARPPSSALDFFASLIVEFRQLRPLYGPGGDLSGLRVQAVVVKNRLAAPGGSAELELAVGRGLRRAEEVVRLGLALGLLERRSAGLVWERTFLGRSQAVATAELESDPDLLARLAQVLAGHAS
jgi:recombination protein RecA